MSDQRLEQAIEQIQAEKVEEARALLEQVIKEDRHNIAAWQAYADTWPHTRDKVRVWELCLRHNPVNLQAQQAIAVLAPHKKIQEANPAREKQPSKRRSYPWLLWLSIGLLAVVAVAAVLAVRNSTLKDPAEYRHVQPVEYYLYVPDAYSDEQEWPLFVGIHGAGGTGLDCWRMWQAQADKEGYILLCPSIPGDSSGFYQDVGENTVWSAIGEVQKEYRIRKRIFFSGFSAGAFFIQGFTYHYPQYVSGLSVLSSGMYMEPSLFPELVPMAVVIGSADDPQAVETSQLFVDGLKSYGFDVQYTVLPGVGHAVTGESIGQTIDVFRKTVGK
ncbi:MAG TPA: hypothetical protein VFY26_16265 [Anaerolineales bacterium]|nr:hypothetical protein [Anaerolineales bacterium]